MTCTNWPVNDKEQQPIISPRSWHSPNAKRRLLNRCCYDLKTQNMDLYYTVLSAPCQSVYMVAKYLGLDVNLRYVNAREYMKQAACKYHMRNCIPTLVDGDFVLSESRAIMTYLVNKYAPDNPIYPNDPQKRAIVERLLYFDLGTLFPTIKAYFKPKILLNQPACSLKEAEMKTAFDHIEHLLGESNYLAGDVLTLADMCIAVSLSMTIECDYDMSSYPNIQCYIKKMVDELPYFRELRAEWKVELRSYIDNKEAERPCTQ